jgi:3-isopropylmalate/(R)-2-methylmalate dehydratase small subunit
MQPFRVVEGAVSVLPRDDVDTDQIVPKQFLKRTHRSGFAETLFYDWRTEPGWSLPRNPLLATGRNFGCGSSREQAPWALEDYGFRAIIAPSFGDIFYSNCTKIGLLPVELEADAVAEVMKARAAAVDLERREVRWADERVTFSIDEEIRARLLDGLDDVRLTLSRITAIERFEGSHPPLSTATTDL